MLSISNIHQSMAAIASIIQFACLLWKVYTTYNGKDVEQDSRQQDMEG